MQLTNPVMRKFANCLQISSTKPEPAREALQTHMLEPTFQPKSVLNDWFIRATTKIKEICELAHVGQSWRLCRHRDKFSWHRDREDCRYIRVYHDNTEAKSTKSNDHVSTRHGERSSSTHAENHHQTGKIKNPQIVQIAKTGLLTSVGVEVAHPTSDINAFAVN